MWTRKKAGAVIAFVLVLFQLGSAAVFSLNDLVLRASHVMLAISLALLVTPWSKKSKDNEKTPFFDWIFLGIIIVANINIIVKSMAIYEIRVTIGTFDMFLGALLFLIVLEAARRTAGWPIVILTGLALGLVYLGPILPEALRTRGFPISFLLKSIYFSSSGLYGGITGLSATILSVFLIFGGILVGTGVGEIFVNFALKVAGRAKGGPAKVAIFASAFMGMISGSSMANVAVTGNYTIPMMKRLGYRPEFAAAVESTASTGGTFTPPIMALGAFLMAEILAISYVTICYHAAFLCFLFYLAVYIGVHQEAKRLGLQGLKNEDLPTWAKIWESGKVIVLIAPIVLLLSLIMRGADLTESGFWACIASLGLFFLVGQFSAPAIKERSSKILKSVVQGGLSLAKLAPLIVTSSVLVNILFVGGIATRLIEVTENALSQNMFGGLLIGALVPLVLGMAIPPIGAYVLAAALLAPGMSTFFPPLAVHLFLFFFSCLAQITPPVCGACYVASTIAETNWPKTAFISMKLAVAAFIFPFFAMMAPELMGLGDNVVKTIIYYIPCIAGVIVLSMALFAFRENSIVNWVTRLVLLFAAFLFMYPSTALSLYALGGIICLAICRTVIDGRQRSVARAA